MSNRADMMRTLSEDPEFEKLWERFEWALWHQREKVQDQVIHLIEMATKPTDHKQVSTTRNAKRRLASNLAYYLEQEKITGAAEWARELETYLRAPDEGEHATREILESLLAAVDDEPHEAPEYTSPETIIAVAAAREHLTRSGAGCTACGDGIPKGRSHHNQDGSWEHEECYFKARREAKDA